ncbi:unnamed protein product [Effrenium voratum]|nr:unnamed protein product [Effrenium voratum]
MCSFAASELSKLRRSQKRGSYDKVLVNEILDAGLVAHVAFVDGEGRPRVSPMIYGRKGEDLYLHGHVSAGLLKNGSLQVCFCMTLEDGLVLGRSGMHSSMNYRCVVVHGTAEEVEGAEKWQALDVVVEHMCQGRTAQVRAMTEAEVQSTRVLRLRLEDGQVSAKVRDEGAIDDKEDVEQLSQLWAGVIPIRRVYGPPVWNPDCADTVKAPPNVANYPELRSGGRQTPKPAGASWQHVALVGIGVLAGLCLARR